LRLPAIIAGDKTADRVVPPSGVTAALTTISAAAMAFLAVFTIALALAAGELAHRWEAELSGTATVRISASPDQIDAQVDAAMAALRQTPGISRVRLVDVAEQQALLSPWFGSDLPLEALRLPTLIDVTETDEGPDQAGLFQRLAAEAPGAVYDNHDRWREPLVEAAKRLRQLGWVSLFMIAGVTSVSIALAASASLAANGQIVDVLRLVGARDRWIIRAFVRRFSIRALFGAIGGTICAIVAVALIPGGVETGVLSGLGFEGLEWIWPLLVPVAAGALAWCATLVAALRRLRKAG